jgi:hypothetical protein
MNMTDRSDKMLDDKRFWEIIDKHRLVSPMTGACLVFAKALQLTFDTGALVRIESNIQGNQTEHYGLQVENLIYDANGVHESPSQWIQSLVVQEGVTDRALTFSTGFDDDSDIPDIPQATRELASLMREHRLAPDPNISFSSNVIDDDLHEDSGPAF